MDLALRVPDKRNLNLREVELLLAWERSHHQDEKPLLPIVCWGGAVLHGRARLCGQLILAEVPA
eukprot:scaffold43986_cov59-Phaeocystis_antarctica.AAC.8